MESLGLMRVCLETWVVFQHKSNICNFGVGFFHYGLPDLIQKYGRLILMQYKHQLQIYLFCSTVIYGDEKMKRTYRLKLEKLSYESRK